MEDHPTGQSVTVKNELLTETILRNRLIHGNHHNINNFPTLYVKLEKIELNNLRPIKEPILCSERTRLNNISSHIDGGNSGKEISVKESDLESNKTPTIETNQNILNSKVTQLNNINRLNKKTIGKDFQLITKQEVHHGSSSKADSKKIFGFHKRRIEEEIQIKQEEIDIVDLPCSSTESGKPTVPKKYHNNKNPINGIGFLHTPFHANPILQSILRDIVMLRREYKSTDGSSLDEEVAKMRAKHNLPSLTDLDQVVISDLEIVECSSQGSEDDVGSSLNQEDVQEASISRQISNDDEDSGRLVIDEESEYKQTNKSESDKYLETIEIKGTILDIDCRSPECPACAKMFKSINTLKQHLKICPLLNPVSTKQCDVKIDQVFSMVPAIPNQRSVQCCVSWCNFVGHQTEVQEHYSKEHSERLTKKPKLHAIEVIEIDDD